jgi:DNA repair exonuclease SbcCD ATPase subunit
MNTLHNLGIILGYLLNMNLPEFLVCELGALVLGFTIHFFWKSKKAYHFTENSAAATGISDNDNWKLKYYNDMDMHERSQRETKEKLAQAQESEQILTIELEETREQLEKLQAELEETQLNLEDARYKLAPKETEQKETDPATEYFTQLKAAQEKLVEHNSNIYRLLEQTQLLGEIEKKNQDLQRQNEELSEQLRTKQQVLIEKETEIGYLRHQQKLSEEMSLRLDKVYEDYNTLQDKLQKLQGVLNQPYNRGSDYEELKENYFKMGKEHDEMKLRHISLREENQRLTRILADTEEKLKEANFQRLQFQKRTAFLEELNRDLQEISEHNKKIESQLRRVSDMENLLARITGAAGGEESHHP